MATVEQLRAHLNGGGDPKKVAKLKRYVQITGAAAGNPGAGAPGPPQSAADSAWGGLKAVGSNTLHALSVPQATVFTGIAKASGRDLSWKNAFGDFRKDAAGRTGGEAALNSMGVHNALARLGISIVADPLWLVGGGLVKGAKVAEEVGKGVSTASTATDAMKTLKAVQGDIQKIARNAVRTKDPKIRDAHLRSIEKLKPKLKEAQAAVDKERHAAKVARTPLEKLLKTDEFGNITNKDDALEKVRVALTKDIKREDMNYSVNFGLGKFKKKFDTGISAERRLAGRGKGFRPGVMGMKPVEKIAHALRRSGAETAEGVPASVLQMASKYGLTISRDGKGGGEILNPTDANLIGVVRSLRSVNDPSGKALEDYLRSKGMWTEGHDQVMWEMDKRYEQLRAADLPDEPRFAKQYEDLAAREKELTKKLNRLIKIADKTDAGPSKKIEKLREQLAETQKQKKLLDERGNYTHQGRRFEDLAAEQERRRKLIQSGVESPAYMTRSYGNPDKALKEREVFDNPFSNVTHDQMVEDMVKAGVDEQEAQAITQIIDSALTNKGIRSFSVADRPPKYAPEWNAFALYERRENAHIWKQVDEQIEKLAKEAGLPTDSAVRKALKIHETGGPFAKSVAGQHILTAVAKFKGLLTFVNPSHYVRNLTGDYWNSMVNGNFRHANPLSPLRVANTRSDVSKLANAQVWAGEGRLDKEALQQVHVIGGREYTGQDLMAMSRMVGLGRGYVGTDIAIMGEAFQRARTSPGEFYKFMQRLNIKRENAQRMHTWIKHMEAGDDPIIAGVKTLRVHFDYTQLTGFERLILRNVLLFYTWMKRNMILQATGVATRPGLYAAAAHMEAARPKIPNEPDYYKKQGAIPIPGWGALNVGSPVGDLWKLELSLDGFRRDVLGAVTPPIRVPAELATNKQFFTGGDIQKYQGEVKQSAIADALNKLGIPVGTETTAKAGGGKGYGINPQLAYVLSQITGPQAGTVQALSSPDYEGNKAQEGIQRFVGISKQANRPAQFARAAKYKQAKKKADATRARNAQGG